MPGSPTPASIICAGLTALRVLDLHLTGITDAGLGRLRALSQLRSLSLCKTKVEGSGLAHLKSLPSLEKLDLSETPVGDEGVKGLEGMKPLRNWTWGQRRSPTHRSDRF